MTAKMPINLCQMEAKMPRKSTSQLGQNVNKIDVKCRLKLYGRIWQLEANTFFEYLIFKQILEIFELIFCKQNLFQSKTISVN